MMSLKLSIRKVGDVAVVDLSGRITLGEASGELRESLKDLLSKGTSNILLNLAGVSYIDSSGLGELVGGFASVSSRGGRLKLLHLTGRALELMQITKLYSVFETFSDEAEAVRSFQARATSA
jgi:anti-sigma B factor antagonist